MATVLLSNLTLGRVRSCKCLYREGHGGRPRKHEVNESAFESASPEAKYFAGLLFADGCISDRKASGKGKTVMLSLSGADGEHVKQFAKFVESSHPITTKQIHGVQTATQIAIGSNRMVGSLVRYGIVPNKSVTATVPQWLVDDKDWWRGVVDGDGWISWTTQSGGYPLIGLCGSHRAVTQFQEFAKQITNSSARVIANGTTGNCWRIQFAGSHAVKIVRHLYSGDGVALPRKKALAVAVIEWGSTRK